MNKIIQILGTALLIVFSMISVFGQQRLNAEQSVFSTYFLSPVILNPGAAGIGDYHDISLFYRDTWATFPGAPSTALLSYNGPIGNRVGLGILGYTDQFGAFNTTKGKLSLAYKLDLPNNQLGIGLSASFIRHNLSGSALTNELVDSSDPEIIARINGSSYIDASFGIWGVYNNTITYGLTLPSLISQRIDETDNNPDTRDIGFIANVGYKYDLPHSDLVIEPSIYAKQLMGVPFHVDVNLRVGMLREKLNLAVMYSNGAENRLGGMIGFYVDNFGLFYSYNASLNQFQLYNNGTHEFSLNLKLQTLTNLKEDQ